MAARSIVTGADISRMLDRIVELETQNARLRSIINERCLAIHVHDRTYAVRMWDRWVLREMLADPWGPSTGESYTLEEVIAMKGAVGERRADENRT